MADACGVTFRWMTEADLEMVRQHRNAPEMRRWMTTDHEISKEEMSGWFARLGADSAYWMVEWQRRVVGQVSMKHIDLAAGVADPGYMFWDEEFTNEGGNAQAVFSFYRMVFSDYPLRMLEGLTEKSNSRALRMAKMAGGKPFGEREINGKTFVQMRILRGDFLTAWERYKILFE